MLFDQVEGKTTFYLIFALHEMIVANTDIGLNCSVIFSRRLVTWGECTSGTNLVLIKRSLPCNNSINKCSSRKQHLHRSFLNKNKQFNKYTKRVCRFQWNVTVLMSLRMNSNLRTILPCKAKRRYLLTLQVSRYCLSALQNSIITFHIIVTRHSC